MGQAVVASRNVLMFQRRLTRSIAGGARSVFDRGRLLQNRGYQVTFVIMDKSPNPGLALSALRRSGILHPCNEILFVHDLLMSPKDRALCISAPALIPDIPSEAIAVDERAKGNLTTRRFMVDDVARHITRYFVSGEVRRHETRDSAGRIVEDWIHDSNGEPLYIDRFDPETGSHLTRQMICDGRQVFCEIDMTAPLGLGEAIRPYETARQNAAFRKSVPAVSLARRIAESLENKFDGVDELVVIADGENTSQNILRAFRPGWVQGISVLHNNHTESPYSANAPLKRGWQPFLEDMTNVAKVVVLTSQQLSDLQSRFPNMPLVKVNHPVLPCPEVRVKRDPNKVVFVGRLSHQKRLDHLAEIFAYVAKGRPATRFDVYGQGDKKDWFTKMIAEAGLDNVVRLRGFTDRPLDAFASASLTVMTSYYEGLPLTLLEAMSVGTPFVSYDLNYGPREVIRNGFNGVLVENGNPKAAADAVIRLLNNRKKLAEMSAAARQVNETYTPDSHMEAWVTLLECGMPRTVSVSPKV